MPRNGESMGSTGFSVDVDLAVRQYADMVYRLAVANTRVTQDAEDVFQEVFVKLVKSRACSASAAGVGCGALKGTASVAAIVGVAVFNCACCCSWA